MSPVASFVPHAVKQAFPPPLQTYGLHEDVAVPQPPAPSQLWVVKVVPAHVVGLHVIAEGKLHAPVPVQSVAPQAPPVGVQAAEQQRVPLPVTPQMPFEHWSAAPQTAPGPPLATQVPTAPGLAQ